LLKGLFGFEQEGEMIEDYYVDDDESDELGESDDEQCEATNVPTSVNK
jgi:hypothetical protein